MEAHKIRGLAKSMLIDAETYDRMFPNQDHAVEGYGNLIALPYYGEAYKNGNSCFIDAENRPIRPDVFLESVVRNRTAFIEMLYAEKVKVKTTLGDSLKFTKDRPRKSLSGAIKVVSFCKWMKAARDRMQNQGQEPEFYALCCQFAQLEEGERLAYEYGRLHPYSDERIRKKFEQAKEVNRPHTCKTLREEYGYECTCDLDYGVTYCYELANLSFKDLMSAKKGKVHSFAEFSQEILARVKKSYKEGSNNGFPFGYDRLDDLTSLRPGNLIVIAARTGIGKTSFSVDLSRRLTNISIPTYWASMEMSRDEVGMKYLGCQTGIDSRNIMEGNLNWREWKKLLKFQKEHKDLPLFVDDQTKAIDQMIDVFADAIARNGKGVIFIDYIEMIAPLKGESMQQLTARAALELKGMARILDVPVIAMSNFNRKAEQDLQDGSDPMDSWLRNSGLLEQTADVIIYLLGKKGKGVLKRQIFIQKERFTGMENESVFLFFDKATSRFLNHNPRTEDTKIVINAPAKEAHNLDLI